MQALEERRHRTHDLALEPRGRREPRARFVAAEVGVARLHEDAARDEPQLPHDLHRALDEVVEHGDDLGGVGGFLVERRLARDRLRDFALAYRTGVEAARAVVHRRAVPAEDRHEFLARQRPQVADRLHRELRELRGGLGADAGDIPDGFIYKEALDLVRADEPQPVGLGRCAREACDHAVGADAGRDDEPRPLAHPRAEARDGPSRIAVEEPRPREVEVGVVEVRLDHGRHFAAERPDLRGEAAVDPVAPRHDDELGAEAARLREGHPRAKTPRPRLVGAARDAPRPHRHGPPPERGHEPLLDRGEEGVDVEVDHHVQVLTAVTTKAPRAPSEDGKGVQSLLVSLVVKIIRQPSPSPTATPSRPS